ncbi:MAG: hypothetical protein ACFCVE_15710 [Phycisphaerae bacterium]
MDEKSKAERDISVNRLDYAKDCRKAGYPWLLFAATVLLVCHAAVRLPGDVIMEFYGVAKHGPGTFLYVEVKEYVYQSVIIVNWERLLYIDKGYHSDRIVYVRIPFWYNTAAVFVLAAWYVFSRWRLAKRNGH